jgi:hypothetical protein
LLHSVRERCAIVLLVLISLAACSGVGSIPSPAVRGISPERIGRCVPYVGHPCPTPAPTPTPYNGPVGSANNLSASGSPPLVLTSATSHVVYVNYNASVMGDQITFLKNLEGSSFFSYILKQYVPNMGAFSVDPNPHNLNIATQNGYQEVQKIPGDPTSGWELLPVTYYDIGQIRNATAAIANPSGINNIWHIILPNDGASVCEYISGQLSCWGPGGGMKNQCADHKPWNGPFGTTYITEQQDVGVCNTDSQADGNSSTLSHELFETITDPDLWSGWHSGGSEIGDLCQDVSHWMALPVYDILNSTGTFYDIQPEWSNKDAHCYPQYDQSTLFGYGL